MLESQYHHLPIRKLTKYVIEYIFFNRLQYFVFILQTHNIEVIPRLETDCDRISQYLRLIYNLVLNSLGTNR